MNSVKPPSFVHSLRRFVDLRSAGRRSFEPVTRTAEIRQPPVPPAVDEAPEGCDCSSVR